jgi:hypothetical protein
MHTQLLSVNEVLLLDVTHDEAVSALLKVPSSVTLTVSRIPREV